MDGIRDFRMFAGKRNWRYATTMPQWPHEYTVRRFDDLQEDQALFEEAVNFIRTNGERRKFEPTGKTSVYFDVDGRQYWTGAPVRETTIINRAWLDWKERLDNGEEPQSVAQKARPAEQEGNEALCGFNSCRDPCEHA